jgi:DNA-binding response OmpR family regulator
LAKNSGAAPQKEVIVMAIVKEAAIALGNNCFLDSEQELLIKNGLQIALSRTQFRILLCLASHLGQCVTYEALTRYAWGSGNKCCKDELYVYISRIRKLIENNPRQPRKLIAMHGIGYSLLSQNPIC